MERHGGAVHETCSAERPQGRICKDHPLSEDSMTLAASLYLLRVTASTLLSPWAWPLQGGQVASGVFSMESLSDLHTEGAAGAGEPQLPRRVEGTYAHDREGLIKLSARSCVGDEPLYFYSPAGSLINMAFLCEVNNTLGMKFSTTDVPVFTLVANANPITILK